MITAQDLDSAIAECKGKRNPDANTCIMLAAFLTIKEHMFGAPKEETRYSYSAGPTEVTVNYESDTDFGRAIRGKDADDMWALMDEVASTLRVIDPPLYRSIMHRI